MWKTTAGVFLHNPTFLAVAKFICKDLFSYNLNSPLFRVTGLRSQPYSVLLAGQMLPLVLGIWTYVANVELAGHLKLGGP